MHKILILGLLLFFIPASGQGQDSQFCVELIRAAGWKCDKAPYYTSFVREGIRNSPSRSDVAEVECKNGKTYYVVMNTSLRTGERSISVCHKGKCKKIN